MDFPKNKIGVQTREGRICIRGGSGIPSLRSRVYTPFCSHYIFVPWRLSVIFTLIRLRCVSSFALIRYAGNYIFNISKYFYLKIVKIAYLLIYVNKTRLCTFFLFVLLHIPNNYHTFALANIKQK